jgi:purine-nucleoside phosphorylase
MRVFAVDLNPIYMNYESANTTAAFLKLQGVHNPDAGIVLGTGLSGLARSIEQPLEIPYTSIPGFPLSTVESHAGKLIYGTLAGKKVVVMQGRFHFYEGYDFVKATFPIRVLHATGIRVLMLSNAAGSLNSDFRKGDLMLLDDHINMLPGNPLIGPNEDRWGPRFPDMSHPYNENLNALAVRSAGELGITLHKGVYAAVPGPNLETRAEYRFLMKIGADAVGMSTVPEVITAHHMGLPCVAVSVLTDECNPDHLVPVSLEEIIRTAQTAEPNLNNMFRLMLKYL